MDLLRHGMQKPVPLNLQKQKLLPLNGFASARKNLDAVFRLYRDSPNEQVLAITNLISRANAAERPDKKALSFLQDARIKLIKESAKERSKKRRNESYSLPTKLSHTKYADFDEKFWAIFYGPNPEKGTRVLWQAESFANKDNSAHQAAEFFESIAKRMTISFPVEENKKKIMRNLFETSVGFAAKMYVIAKKPEEAKALVSFAREQKKLL